MHVSLQCMCNVVSAYLSRVCHEKNCWCREMTINYQLCQLGIVLLDNDVRLSQVRHNSTVLLEIFLLVVFTMGFPQAFRQSSAFILAVYFYVWRACVFLFNKIIIGTVAVARDKSLIAGTLNALKQKPWGISEGFWVSITVRWVWIGHDVDPNWYYYPLVSASTRLTIQ